MLCPCSVQGQVIACDESQGPTDLSIGAHRGVFGEAGGSKLQCIPPVAAATKLEVAMASLA